jgi:epoxyqueuosine reductase
MGGDLLQLLSWTEEQFLRYTEGSAIRRIGHQRWQRNIVVALGNVLRQTHDPAIVEALRALQGRTTPLIREHVDWALAQIS